MKKHLFCAFLALSLLLGLQSALADGGDRDDPLISLSYVRDTFIPELKKAIAGLISEREKPEQSAERTGRVAVSAGGSVSLEAGQTFVLTDGSAGLSVERGSVVNAGAGAEAGNGAVRPYQRYIVCEDSRVTLEITDDAVLTVAGTAEVRQGDGKVSPFTDVVRGEWYFDDVVSAHERGLIDGMTATAYAPGGTLTAAQCVKLAACMHQLYHDGAVTLVPSAGAEPWYGSYVAYALENGLIERELGGWDSAIDRLGFIRVFYNALPEEEYARLNGIPDGAIPDVSDDADGAREIYAFYRSGILAGYTNTPGYAEHAFGPDSSITRAEVAAIMNRMFDADARIEFDIS